MTKQRNIIIEQMPFAVTKTGAEGVALIEARFRSVVDAVLFRDMIAAKFDALTWKVILQFYNSHGALLSHDWSTPLDVAA